MLQNKAAGGGFVLVFGIFLKTMLPLGQRQIHGVCSLVHTLYIALKLWLTSCFFRSAAYQNGADRPALGAGPEAAGRER